MNAKPYFLNLDASRFFAFFLIFLAHCFVTTNQEIGQSIIFTTLTEYQKLGLGYLALEYFFVLSSFLITYLILEEYRQTGAFHVRSFLIRRSLRVWPLYFLVVGIGFLLTAIATEIFNIDMVPLPEWYWFVFFLVNFYAVEHGAYFLFFMVFLWSISIEEQFYLFWSVVMKLYNKRVFPFICLLLVVISIVFRYLSLDNERAPYFHTVSTLGNFGAGAYLAYIAFYRTRLFNLLKKQGKTILRLFYFVFFTSILLFHELAKYESFIVIQRTFYSVLFACFILDQAFGEHRLFNLGRNRVFGYLGKISYGLYCYHGIVITLLVKVLELSGYRQNYWDVFGLFPVIIFTFTLGISAVSYRYFESRFLVLKKRYDHLIKKA